MAATTNEACESHRRRASDQIDKKLLAVKEMIPKNNKVSWTHFLTITITLLTAAAGFVYIMTQRVTSVEVTQKHTQTTLEEIKEDISKILHRLPHGK